MRSRLVLTLVFLLLVVGGVGVFCWAAGYSPSNLGHRLQAGWRWVVRTVRGSSATERALVTCLLLLGGGMIFLARSMRKA